MPVGASIRVTETGLVQVTNRFARAEAAVHRFGTAGVRATEKFQRVAGGVTSGLSGLYGAIGGLGAAAGAKRILDARDALGQLQVEARLSNKEIKAVQNQIAAIGPQGGVMSGELVQGLSVFQGYGGALQFGRDMLAEMVVLLKATGAPAEDLATISASLHKTFGMTKDEVMASFAAMKSMSIAGTMTMQQVSPDLPQLLGLGKGLGFKGARGVQQLGAAHQVIGGQLVDSGASRTALEGLFRNLIQKQKALKSAGIKVFDAQGNMRDVDVLMLDILRKTKGSIPKLSKVFSDEGIKAAQAFAAHFDKASGNWTAGGNVEAIFSAGKGANTQDLYKDAALRTQGIAKESEKLKSTLATLDAALQKHGGALINWVAQDPKKALLMAGGGLAAWKLGPAVLKGLFGALAGKGGVGGALGALSKGGGAPVFVTNWPGGGLGGSGLGGVAEGAAEGAAGGWLGKGLKTVAKYALPVAAGYAAGTGLASYLEGTKYSTANSSYVKEGRAKIYKEQLAEENSRLANADVQRKIAGAQSLRDMAQKYSDMGGYRTDARGERIRGLAKDALLKAGSSTGLPESTLSELLPVLMRIAAGVEQRPVVEVRPPGGIDRLDVQASRGKR